MKNIFLTSAIIAVMSCPAIALDGNDHIQPSPTNDCVESTLGTATGPANLEADWTANTINLEWYNEDTKLTVPTISNTCTYDGGITLPSTNPTKTGYTFKGWQVRAAQTIDCSTIVDNNTCNNTLGCAFYYYYENKKLEHKCINKIPIETSQYTSCLEITDENVCNQMYHENWDMNPKNSGFLCEWQTYDNKCHMAAYEGGGVILVELPKEWCQNFANDWGNCEWYEPGEDVNYNYENEEGDCWCDFD